MHKLPVKRKRGRPRKPKRKGGRKPSPNQKPRTRILATEESPELGFIELPKKRGRGRPRKPGNAPVKVEEFEEGLYDNVGKKRRRLGKVTD